MIKITFEVSEDFVRENASYEVVTAKMKDADGNEVIKGLIDMIGFSQLKKQIEEGKTEFVVTPDKLDNKSMEIYNKEIGEICLLAAFSETDKKKEEKESED